ncbi:MAG: hypothetical protein CVT78_00110 [Alphaproteobacteria bacterium HGW-Alphaproteobacteria-17]|nr:MAG: hypothetical protein CVT78_00110 [Alphaproteobacteria bacterium HGW-Alphaproteobacteria-17]
MNSISTERAHVKPADAGMQSNTLADRGGLFDMHLLERAFVALLNHKTWVIGSLIVCVAIGMIITFLMTPLYTSTSRIEISPQSLVETDVEGAREKNLQNEIAFYNTQYSLLESRSLAERTVRAGNLLNDEEFVRLYGLDEEGSFGAINSSTRERMTKRAVGVLMKAVEITPVRQSSLVDVSFATPSPALSAKLTNLWVKQFVAANLDRRFSATSDARRFLEQRIGLLRKNLEDSERSLISYATNNGIITLQGKTDASGRVVERTLVAADVEQVNESLAQARNARIAAESQLSGSTSAADVSANAAISALRQKRSELSADLARLQTTLGEEYPEVVAKREQIDALNRAISIETRRTQEINRETYASTLKRERELTAELDRITGNYRDQQRRSIEYAILQREVDTNRQLYDGLLQRYKEIGVAGVGTNNIAVVDVATPATIPSSPRLILNLLLSIIAGMIIAAVLVFILEQLDHSIRDPAEVSERFGLPLLGSIPKVESENFNDLLLDKKSMVYEAYLAAQTNLTFLTPHGAPSSFLLTSTRPAEGKSSSSLSLANVFVSTGKKVILIDADIRSPSLNEMLEIENKQGLSNYLTGSDDLSGLIAKSDRFGFDYMLAGPTPPNAAELFSSSRLSKLIELLQKEYDHVILDSPPVLGLADAPLLSRQVEGVIFAIDASSNSSRAIKSALNRLRQTDAQIYGAVVTKVGRRNEIYGYGYGYGYGHGYGYGADKSRADDA